MLQGPQNQSAGDNHLRTPSGSHAFMWEMWQSTDKDKTF